MPTLNEARSPNQYFKTHVLALKSAPGRPKGSRNRIGVNVRQSIERVFGAMGHWEGMMAWAKDNPDVFYGQVVPKLLPHELAESGVGQSIRVIVYGKDSLPNQSIDVTPGGLVSDNDHSVVLQPVDNNEKAP